MCAVKLQVTNPCHESWNGMTPAGQGRHCAACDKVVIDFTTFSDKALLAFFSQPRTGTCGRFLPGQLDRQLTAPAQPRRAWLPAAVLAALALVQPGKSPAAGKPQITWSPISAAEKDSMVVIKGQMCGNGEAFPGGAVQLGDTQSGTMTDQNGEFTFNVPYKAVLNGDHLVFKALGYEMQRVQLSLKNYQSPILVNMPAAITGLAGEVVITRQVSPFERLVWWFKNLF